MLELWPLAPFSFPHICYGFVLGTKKNVSKSEEQKVKVAWVMENFDVYPNISTYLNALQGMLKFKDVDTQTFQPVSLH